MVGRSLALVPAEIKQTDAAPNDWALAPSASRKLLQHELPADQHSSAVTVRSAMSLWLAS